MTGQPLQVRLARFKLTGCFYQQHQHKMGHGTTPLQSPSLQPATTPKQLPLPAWSPLIPALCQLLFWEPSENQQKPLLCPSHAELLCPFPTQSISDSSEQHKSRGQTKAWHSTRAKCSAGGSLRCGSFKIDQSSAGLWHRDKKMELQHSGFLALMFTDVWNLSKETHQNNLCPYNLITVSALQPFCCGTQQWHRGLMLNSMKNNLLH